MRSSAYGIHPMPLSPKEIRRFGYRSSTAAPMIAARMLTRFIWNADTPVNNAARRVRPVGLSRAPGGVLGDVWEGSGRVTSLAGLPHGLPPACHHGVQFPAPGNTRP